MSRDRSKTHDRYHRTINERSLANLKPPWPKGVSGNPAGQPKGYTPMPGRTFTQICQKYLSEPIAPGDERTRAEALAMMLYSQGMKGNHKAACVILDRVDPAPKTNITINNSLRVPIMDALDELGVKRAAQFDGEVGGA